MSDPSDPKAVLYRVIDPQTEPLGVEVFLDEGEAEVYADDEPGAYVRPLCYADEAAAALADLRDNPRDKHHTMAEVYRYRMLYNVHAARGWLAEGISVVRSRRHSDGEPCFGGGWFIVVATLPSGQVSNHYREDGWDLFGFVPEVDLPPAYDGHTPDIAAQRLRDDALRDRGPAVAADPADRADRVSPGGVVAWRLLADDGRVLGVSTDTDEVARWQRPDVEHLHLTVDPLTSAPAAAAAPSSDAERVLVSREDLRWYLQHSWDARTCDDAHTARLRAALEGTPYPSDADANGDVVGLRGG